MPHLIFFIKVAVLPFATSTQLRKELDQVAEWISTLTSSAELEQNLKSNNNNSSLKLARYTSKNEDIFKAVQQDNQQELQALLKEDTRVSKNKWRGKKDKDH